jgi:hypothetical protein
MIILPVEPIEILRCHACHKQPATVEIRLNGKTSLDLCAGCRATLARLLTLWDGTGMLQITRPTQEPTK